MDTASEKRIARWEAAGVVDAATVERIRAWEREHAPGHASRFGRIAFALGGLLLASGVLLFVAANWAQMSPWGRFTLLAALVAALHVAAAAVSPRSKALATTLHAVGTAALGGGVFLAGQVFNLAEHWPEGFLLWAAGAAVAALLVLGWPQLLWVALLVPAWLVSEWASSLVFRSVPGGVPLVGLFVLAVSYAAAVGPGRDATWRHALAILGAITLLVVAGLLPLEPGLRPGDRPATSAVRAVAWALALVLPLSVGAALRGRQAWPLLVAALVAVLASQVDVSHSRDLLVLHALYAAASVGLAWWGVREAHRLRINLGVLAFAMTLLSFYFSSLLDKLGRSLGLIGLGVLFIGGGWLLERTRRQLVQQSRRERP